VNAPTARAGYPAAFRIAYDAVLVEESVLLAEGRLSAADAASFRAERDRIYGVNGDPDEREARFEELHGRFFLRLGLDGPLHEALADHPELLHRTRACRVLPAVSHREETADARAEVGAPPEAAPTIVVRLRPQSLLDPEALRTLLRRELLHVADMLDPGFGYLRELPGVETDPAAVSLLRERYRVVWDATIDGRLYRAGLLGTPARAARLFEFARAFPMLGEGIEAAFAPWFDGPRPAHAAIVAFIQEPRGPGTADEARCPLCRLPARTLERGPAGLDRHVLGAIERDHPGWRPEQGRCTRCAEVYGALLPMRG
jgi:hypothetical protein